MNYPEKQLKYSIRKVSVGAASVVIGALYLLMGAGLAHADGVESAREANRAANPTDADQSGTGEPENKANLSNTDAVASTYNAPVAENPLVAPGSAKPRGKRALPDGETGGTSNGDTGTESGNNQPTGENSPVLDANRKGEIVKTDQPGVHVPKDGENGSDDKNANLTFDTPDENATVEYMYKIIKNMPDDFQDLMKMVMSLRMKAVKSYKMVKFVKLTSLVVGVQLLKMENKGYSPSVRKMRRVTSLAGTLTKMENVKKVVCWVLMP